MRTMGDHLPHTDLESDELHANDWTPEEVVREFRDLFEEVAALDGAMAEYAQRGLELLEDDAWRLSPRTRPSAWSAGRSRIARRWSR